MSQNVQFYTTGKFSKLAGVTPRTLRYYDKIGLLKPSSVAENGYRIYTDMDLMRLQKILSLRELGFSISEIFPLILDDSEKNMEDSINFQIELITKKIQQLDTFRHALKNISTSLIQKDFEWNRIIELINLIKAENVLVEHYQNTANLNIRIQLHNLFSVNKTGWFKWLFQHIDFKGVNRLLEIGAGNGALWEQMQIDARNREIFLSDKSEGMVEELKKKFKNDFNYLTIDCESIPFKNEYFDAVIANHVLFYVDDLERGLAEIARVLSPAGTLYCSTYGKNHMREIRELVKEYDPRIQLSKNDLFERFGLEQGRTLLEPYFSNIEVYVYPDELIVYDVKPLINYIMSCHGNQNEILGKDVNKFGRFLQKKMDEKGYLKITKSAGVFIAKK